ncbi:hypothetical protein FRX31_011890 [Thalictrum thalictroides]|uniref:S-protein homolog n=1 Tax=Thalictrum thalictroides TaxID=46969 RepID=A0A7J6WNK7_THATH|nr:hypothetical protein FRX31_011890 [Thalictrum thalictroides]
MASGTNKNNLLYVFLVTVVITCLIWSCSSVKDDHSSSVSGVSAYARVVVWNALGPNNTLTVHCKSKDDDLGEQNIDFNRAFEWSFQNNIFGRTLFWCRMWWYDHHKLVWGSYRVYKGSDDIDRCGTEGFPREAPSTFIFIIWCSGRFQETCLMFGAGEAPFFVSRLFNKTEKENRFDHPMGGLTIPYNENN